MNKPKVGQVWIDNDPRHQNPPRRLLLVSLHVSGRHWFEVEGTKRMVRIHEKRLRPTSNGYRLEDS